MGINREKNQFAIVLLLMMVLMFMIVLPFMNGLAWALLFCVLANPIYNKLLNKFGEKHQNAAAGIVTALIVFFMLVPVIWLLLFVISEAVEGYVAFVKSGGLPALIEAATPYLEKLPFVSGHIDIEHLTETPVFTKVMSSMFGWLTAVGQFISRKIAGGTAKMFLLIAVVGFSSFYFLRDSKSILSFVYDLLPLEEKDKAELFSGIREAILAIVYGLVLTSVVQGIVGAVGWYFAGLPSAVFFGFLMFVFGMLPMIGTAFVWGAGVIYLLFVGDVTHAVFLFVWGAAVVGTVDNFIRPIFIAGGGNSDLNMLVVFLGLLGGVSLWGFVGLVYGPLILTLGFYLLETYRKRIVNERLGEVK